MPDSKRSQHMEPQSLTNVVHAERLRLLRSHAAESFNGVEAQRLRIPFTDKAFGKFGDFQFPASLFLDLLGNQFLWIANAPRRAARRRGKLTDVLEANGINTDFT